MSQTMTPELGDGPTAAIYDKGGRQNNNRAEA